MEAHRAEHDKRQADRIKTILYLDEGKTYEEIERLLFLDDTTLRRYKKEYVAGGLDMLLEDKYKGSTGSLSTIQETELKQHLVRHTYHRAKDICEHIKNTYAVEYTPEGLVHLLHRLGFSYKKMKQVPGKADPEKQKEFLQTYEIIKQNMGETDELYFLDGSHPQHNSMPAYGWILKGEEKELNRFLGAERLRNLRYPEAKRRGCKTNTGRQRINLNGALNLKDHSAVVLAEDTINADAMITLLEALEAKHPHAENIHCIADNAKYNHAKKVTEYLNTSRVHLHYLPPYAPNLNLIERLWKFFHKKVLYNKYYESFIEFKTASLDFFKNMHQYHQELDTLLTENFHIIGERVSQT